MDSEMLRCPLAKVASLCGELGTCARDLFDVLSEIYSSAQTSHPRLVGG